jgi:hypothetical protein
MSNESQVLEVTGSTSDKKPTAQVALKVDQITGYDGGETQTLKHVSGVLTWVTDV